MNRSEQYDTYFLEDKLWFQIICKTLYKSSVGIEIVVFLLNLNWKTNHLFFSLTRLLTPYSGDFEMESSLWENILLVFLVTLDIIS